MKKIKMFLSVGIVALVFFVALSFAYRNFSDVSVDYYFDIVQLPLAFALLIALSIGVTLGFFASIPVALKRRSVVKNKTSRAIQKTIEE